MKNNKSNKNSKQRRSLKGKWGKVGAPPKAIKFPRGAFTMESLFNMNGVAKGNNCELTIRTKVANRLADGSLIQLKARKQAGGKVGRPKAVFVLKENFDKDKHEKADVKVKTAKTRNVVTVTASVAPTAPPVPEATPVAATAPATIEPQPEVTAPTPEVTAPAEAVATVEAPVAHVDTAAAPASEPVIA